MKKRNKRITILFILPILALVFVYLVRKDDNFSDWIVLLSGLLTYSGTILLGYLAIKESENTNLLSEKLLKFEEREFVPTFYIKDVQCIKYSNCIHRSTPKSNDEKFNRAQFCFVDFAPIECQGFNLKLYNLSKYPITSYTLQYIYPIGNKGKTEEQKKNINDIIPPNAQYSLDICMSNKLNSNIKTKLIIECTNDFDMTYKVEIDIYITDSSNPIYECRVLKD